MGREDAREGGRPEIFPYLSQSTVIAIVRPSVRSFVLAAASGIYCRPTTTTTTIDRGDDGDRHPARTRQRTSASVRPSDRIWQISRATIVERLRKNATGTVLLGEVEFRRRDEISSVIFIQPSGHLRETDPSSMRRLVHRPMKRGNGSGRVRTRTDEHILGATSFIYFCWR